MKSIWDFIVSKLPDVIKSNLLSYLKTCRDENPNDCLQKAAFQTLKNVLEQKKDIGKEELLNLSTLTCALTPKMRADKELTELLKRIDHPFVRIYAIYFEENPSNYQEALRDIEIELSKLEKLPDYTLEQQALVLAIESWVYGQQSNIVKLKEIHLKSKGLLSTSSNPVIQLGTQDAFLNIIWWYLHLGLEENVQDLLAFLEPYVMKYKFYRTYTSFFNVKGAVASFFGDNIEAIANFQKLIQIHSEYNDNYRLSIAIGNLAEVYVATGKIKQAKEMMEKAIKLYKTSTDKWPYLYLTELGNIYSALNDSRAEESFLHAYEIQKKERSIHKAYILFELIHYFLRKEQLQKAEKFLHELKSLTKELEAPSINARLDYLEGFYEVLRLNLANGVTFLQKALELAQRTKDAELLQFCNIQLSTAYLLYFKFQQKNEYLNMALNYIDAVYHLAEENHHLLVLIIASMIRSISIMLTGDLKKAEEELQKLEQKKGDMDTSYFTEDIQNIKKAIIQAKETGEVKIAPKKAIEYLLPHFKLLLNFKIESKQAKEAEVLGILIIAETGIPVYSKLKSSLKTNDLLLSGLLMAINQLANSIVEGQKGRLREVRYLDFAITIQAIKNGMVAVIATRVTANVRIWALSIAERLKKIPEEVIAYTNPIEEQIGDLLEEMNLNQTPA